MEPTDDIPTRANRVLHLILIAFMLIALKVCLLTLVKRDHWEQVARAPTLRTVVTPTTRGVIKDRFGTPLAEGRIDFVASITYSAIREIPRVRWITNSSGKKEKRYVRKEFICRLAQTLSSHLNLEAEWIEDVIYSKASLFPNTPFTIKAGLPEEVYCRLKMLEKDFPGLTMHTNTARHYPKGALASNIIGFLGSINQSQHLSVHNEIAILKEAIEMRDAGEAPILPAGFTSWRDVRARLDELTEMSYSLTTLVGKAGIEAKFDEELRGRCGKSLYEVDTMGRYLRRLPDSREAQPGKNITLTISSELQEYATKLLGASERRREDRFRLAGKRHGAASSPWIKGGAIVAMDPHTGEILCLATSPEFNSADFLPDSQNRKNIHKWLESERHIGQIWDGITPLTRDWFSLTKGVWKTDTKPLNWSHFLERVLSTSGTTRRKLLTISRLDEAVYLQNTFDMLLSLSKTGNPKALINTLYPEDRGHVQCKTPDQPLEIDEELLGELRAPLDHLFAQVTYNYDKLLILDILRLAAPAHLFSDELVDEVGALDLDTYRNQTQLYQKLRKELKDHLQTAFHKTIFAKWRRDHFAAFLKERRAEEKAARKYNKPYLDYLQSQERKMFQEFLKNNEERLIIELISDVADPILSGFTSPLVSSLGSACPKKQVGRYLRTLRSFHEMDRAIYSTTPRLKTERDLASAFYPRAGYSYMKSLAFQEASPLGSIFKLVTAYEAVNQIFHREGKLNPLTIVDAPSRQKIKNRGNVMGYTLDRKPITRHYKGGRLPRSFRECGEIELEGAFEASSNIYYSLLASEVLDHPNDLADTTRALSFGHQTGLDLPGEVTGNIPDDLADNKTGLYSFAIGQHSLTVTPVQTAIMLSALATNGEVLKPRIVAAIETPNAELSQESPLAQYPKGAGINFPLFAALNPSKNSKQSVYPPRKVLGSVDLPTPVQRRLIEALSLVVHGKRGSARVNAIASLYEYPAWRKTYKEVFPTLIGKTATAEILYRPCLDREFKSIMCKHIWFGGISYEDRELTKPELVVVVFLRYGDYGKEAAPLAAEVISKWRKIQRAHAEKALAKSHFEI